MRTETRRKAVAAAVLTPLLLGGLTACGGDKKPASADATPTASSSSTPTSSATDQPVGVEVSKADAAALFENMQRAMTAAKTAHVAMNLGTGGAQGVISFGGGQTAMELSMDLGESGLSGVTMRLVDGEMYVSMTGLTAKGKFIKFSQGDKTLGANLNLDSFKNLSPSDTAKLMKDSLRKLVKVGDETIDGQDTVHYRVTVDTAKSQDLVGKLTPAQLAKLPETLDYDLFVTKDNLIRRVIVGITGSSAQIDYTDWGRPVDIKAPAAKDIIKMPPGL